jgi:hypothetical protein
MVHYEQEIRIRARERNRACRCVFANDRRRDEQLPQPRICQCLGLPELGATNADSTGCDLPARDRR